MNPTDLRTALSLVRDASEILGLLLAGGHSTIVGRLAGAFRNIGRDRIADEIIKTMSVAGYDVREINPFEEAPTISILRRGRPANTAAYLKHVEEAYVTDAYHSLSIEGYRVDTEQLE